LGTRIFKGLAAKIGSRLTIPQALSNPEQALGAASDEDQELKL
jgi:hypothetical protein